MNLAQSGFASKSTGIFWVYVLVMLSVSAFFLPSPRAEMPAGIFTLSKTVDAAVKANLQIKSLKEETQAARSVKDSRRTEFLPKFSTNYQYTRHDEERSMLGFGVTRPQNEYVFSASVTQPLFTGFALTHQYEIAALGLDAAVINEKLIRQDIILEAKKMYFQLLKARKLFTIAKQTVAQIDAQKEVARNFYQVGMTPLNDLLQSQVELANAQQEMIVARNDQENAASDFNLLLRRPINAAVSVEDILDYTPFEQTLDACIAEAEKNRSEIVIARLAVEQAQKSLGLARKDFYPTVTLEGTYYRQGIEWDVDGGEGITNPDGWDISAMATWTFWEWGKASFGVKEKRSRLSQAKFQQTSVVENIQLEVKKALLRTQEAERAIITIEKAIVQAEENFRINEERYKEQVATSTDVLDAQTLLARTMTNYYNALYEFKIAKASLYRAMGREIVE